MITLLSRLLIPDRQNTDLPEVRRRYGVLSGAVGIFLNLLLFAGKLAAGLLAHSVSITADAFNNLSDAASSVMTLVGFRLAGKRPDRDHPFGHGRIEYITGLLVSVSILLMGAELLRTSVSRILAPRETVYSAFSAAILLLSIGVKLYMFYYNRSLGRMIGSVALHSTAMDSLSDCVSTSVVLICMLAGRVFGISLDGWCGLAVSVFILRTGLNALLETASPLLGEAPDPDFISQIKEKVLSTPGITGMHDLLVHDYGPGHVIVSLHAEVPASLSLVEAHEIIDRLESSLDERFGIMSVIHIDPVDKSDMAAAFLKDRLTSRLHAIHPEAGLHDLRILRGDGVPVVSFDAVLPYSVEMSDERIVEELSTFVTENTAGYRSDIRVDRK